MPQVPEVSVKLLLVEIGMVQQKHVRDHTWEDEVGVVRFLEVGTNTKDCPQVLLVCVSTTTR